MNILSEITLLFDCFTVDYTGSLPNSNGTGPTDVNKLMDKVELNDEDDEEDTGSKKDDLSEAHHAESEFLTKGAYKQRSH